MLLPQPWKSILVCSSRGSCPSLCRSPTVYRFDRRSRRGLRRQGSQGGRRRRLRRRPRRCRTAASAAHAAAAAAGRARRPAAGRVPELVSHARGGRGGRVRWSTIWRPVRRTVRRGPIQWRARRQRACAGLQDAVTAPTPSMPLANGCQGGTWPSAVKGHGSGKRLIRAASQSTTEKHCCSRRGCRTVMRSLGALCAAWFGRYNLGQQYSGLAVFHAHWGMCEERVPWLRIKGQQSAGVLSCRTLSAGKSSSMRQQFCQVDGL